MERAKAKGLAPKGLRSISFRGLSKLFEAGLKAI